MKTLLCLVIAALVVSGCGQSADSISGQEFKSVLEARRGFATKLVRQVKTSDPVPQPPAGVLKSVKYRSPIGEMAAYVSHLRQMASGTRQLFGFLAASITASAK